MVKGVDERTDEMNLRWIDRMVRMGNDKIGKISSVQPWYVGTAHFRN